MDRLIQFPMWTVRESVLMKACRPREAKKRAQSGVERAVLAHLAQMAATGNRAALRPGDTFEHDGITVVFE